MNYYSRVAAAGRWGAHLKVARACAQEASDAVSAQFGHRRVLAYRDRKDIQLQADLTAQKIITRGLREAFPDYGVVAEEGDANHWTKEEMIWVVDPLDGTNNFGYGIAHCAISIALFSGDSIALGLVSDPLLKREFFATGDICPRPRPLSLGAAIRPDRATVSLVTNYSDEAEAWQFTVEHALAGRCKRVITMWAPALDLALISAGALDAMVCHEGYFLDVCGGLFLVHAAGGCILGADGTELDVRRSLHAGPVSFVAARTPRLARDLLALLDTVASGQGF